MLMPTCGRPCSRVSMSCSDACRMPNYSANVNVIICAHPENCCCTALQLHCVVTLCLLGDFTDHTDISVHARSICVGTNSRDMASSNAAILWRYASLLCSAVHTCLRPSLLESLQLPIRRDIDQQAGEPYHGAYNTSLQSRQRQTTVDMLKALRTAY